MMERGERVEVEKEREWWRQREIEKERHSVEKRGMRSGERVVREERVEKERDKE